MEAIAESQELLNGNEAKPYLGSIAAVLLAYEPPQTQATPAGASQVGRRMILTVFSLPEPKPWIIPVFYVRVPEVEGSILSICYVFGSQRRCNHVCSIYALEHVDSRYFGFSGDIVCQ